jgi:hypothetical protein
VKGKWNSQASPINDLRVASDAQHSFAPALCPGRNSLRRKDGPGHFAPGDSVGSRPAQKKWRTLNGRQFIGDVIEGVHFADGVKAMAA